jgi:Protein of unknown function (DUF1236)
MLRPISEEINMKSSVFGALALAAVVVTPASFYAQGALAQGAIGGAAEGARQGARDAGPVGGVVGGAVGGAVGAATGLLGIDEGPRFRQYVQREHRRSFRYDEPVRVGAILPEEGVEFYDVPREYGVTHYRYTVVDDEPVLVDPSTRRIVQIIR